MRAHKVFRALILFWTAFIGIGAVVGSMMFFLRPNDGFVMGEILPQLREKLPFGELLFSNFIFSGISLLIVNGISNLTAFVLILCKKRAGYIAGFVFGLTLMAWIGIQFYVFAPVVWGIDIAFFTFGLLQFICGYLAYVYFSKTTFEPYSGSPDSAGIENTREAVVFFSREGYAKKLACEKADELKCALIEIKSTERTQGTPGFWWCGRFGMHRWGMPIEATDADFSAFERVYVYSPVWVFRICAPIRQFLTEQKDKLSSVMLTTVQFTRSRYKGAENEVRALLGEHLSEYSSVCSKFGRFKEIKE